MWKADLFLILGMQGFGLFAGTLIYGASFPEQPTWYWALGWAAMGIVSILIAWKIAKRTLVTQKQQLPVNP